MPLKSKRKAEVHKEEVKREEAKNEVLELSDSEDDDVKSKNKKGTRSKKEIAKEEVEKDKETRAQGSKKRGGGKNAEEPPAKKVKEFEKPETDITKINFDCERSTEDGKKWNIKISTWNVAGLRAWVKKNGLDFLNYEKPDILCLQETKCSKKKLPPQVEVNGYYAYWLSAEKEGYSGVALYSKEKPINITYGIDMKEHDSEGRVITAEYEKFFLINAYVPNAGQGLKTLPKRMKWDLDFRNYLKKLDEKKPIILCGDLNVAHTEIDLANPKTNAKNAGFTPEEREGMTELLKQGFVDTFRKLYPERIGAYTFWSYFSNSRAKNTGWRLDYFIVSDRFLPHLCDNIIRNGVLGSDHCPVTLFLNL